MAKFTRTWIETDKRQPKNGLPVICVGRWRGDIFLAHYNKRQGGWYRYEYGNQYVKSVEVLLWSKLPKAPKNWKDFQRKPDDEI